MSSVPTASYKPSDKVRAFLDKEDNLGNLPTGARLPTAEELATRLDVSSGTVKNVYRALAQEGKVKTQVGVGSFWIGPTREGKVETLRIGLGLDLPPQGAESWWLQSPWTGAIFGGVLKYQLNSRRSVSLRHCGDLLRLSPAQRFERLSDLDGVIAFSLAPIPFPVLNRNGGPIPLVSLNPPLDQACVNFVSPDYFECSYTLGAIWRRTGRKRILMVTLGPLEESVSTRMRYSGLVCGVGEGINREVEVRLLCIASSVQAEVQRAFEQFFAEGWIPDAVYTAGGILALPALTALRRLGLSIPEEVSLVGGSQNGISATSVDPLTTMLHPLEEVGARLLEQLLARIVSGGRDEPGRYLPVPFFIGATTRPAENEALLESSRRIARLPLSVSPIPQPAKKTSSMSHNTTTPITVAIVGLGRAGWHLHLQPFLSLPGFKIVGVADPVPERCKEAADLTGCKQYASIDELLADTEASTVVVATPSTLHYSDALKVLNSGRHCILEKPIAMTASEADEIVALAKERNLKLFVNHTHLHRNEYPFLAEIIKSGILGPIFHIRAFWGNYARRWDWQTLKKNGGGGLNNTCPHTLSIILPLLGSRVKDVYADLRNIKDAGDAEDHVHLVLRTEEGPTADVVVSTAIALGGTPKWIIGGKYGTLTSDGATAKLRYYNPAKATPLSVLDTAAPDRQYLSEQLPWEEKELTIPETTNKPFHENIYDVLVHGAAQIVTPESAAEVVRVTEMAHKAAVNH